MAYQAIGRGTSANDGTGDDLRTGAGKVNANFVEIYTKIGDGSTLTSDTVTLNTATQTLTNKTLTSPTITGTGAIAGTFTGDVTGDVTGDLTGAVDLNGGVLTLDADADTTITADTDDQIDIAFGGNDRITLSTGLIDVKNDGTQSEVRLYCESSNAHYAGIQAPAHADFSGNITVTLPASTTTLVGTDTTDTLTNKSLTSPTITGTGTATLDTVTAQLISDTETLTHDGSTTLVAAPGTMTSLIVSSASATAVTLADGTTEGTLKMFVLKTDGGGDATITPTTFANGSTITMADANDTITLMWVGTNGWTVISNEGSTVA